MPLEACCGVYKADVLRQDRVVVAWYDLIDSNNKNNPPLDCHGIILIQIFQKSMNMWHHPAHLRVREENLSETKLISWVEKKIIFSGPWS